MLGLDRSGPNPDPTRPGRPLRPFTLPNAIGLLRLIAIPVFLVIALSDDPSHHSTAAILFAAAGAADYLDGLTARVTGQYSRLGALLDPVVDRLLVIAGMAVVWRFDLLPRWALALAIARELSMLGMSRYALHRDLELTINWAGRLAVAPIIGAPFFALLNVHVLALVLLYAGLALALSATALYMRAGVAALRQVSSSA